MKFFKIILMTFMKVTRETPDLVKIRQNYRALYMKISIRLYCWEQNEIFCSSPTVLKELIPAFPLQKPTVVYCWQLRVCEQYKENALYPFHSNIGLRERTTVLHYTYMAYFLLISNKSGDRPCKKYRTYSVMSEMKQCLFRLIERFVLIPVSSLLYRRLSEGAKQDFVPPLYSSYSSRGSK